MVGHIQQRGESTWRLHAFIGQDSKGKRRCASKTFQGSKKQASTALAAFVTETAKDRSPSSAAEPMTDRYRVAIKHIDAVIGSMKVARLRPHHIEDFYTALYADGQSGSSSRKVLGPCVSHSPGHIDGGTRRSSPQTGSNCRFWARRKSNRRPQSTCARLLTSSWPRIPTGARSWPGPAVAAGKLLASTGEDVDLTQGNLLIRRAVAAIPGGVQVKGTKTGDIRRIAIGPRTVELLKAHQKRANARANECGVTIETSVYIFSPDPASARPYYPYTITRTFANACKDAGAPHTRLHDLRHHSATTLLKGGSRHPTAPNVKRPEQVRSLDGEPKQ
jgi:hypothetical protein